MVQQHKHEQLSPNPETVIDNTNNCKMIRLPEKSKDGSGPHGKQGSMMFSNRSKHRK
jgi:hypothetical protein